MTNGDQPQYPQQQPPYQQPGGQYQQQPPQQPGQYPGGGYPQTPKNNGMAITALILGIVGLFCWIGSIPAVIFGYLGRRQIKESGGTQTGDGMAMAGIVMGWIGVAILILYLILLAVGAATFTFETS